MKLFTLVIITVFISIILAPSIGLVSALNQDEASVTVSWLSPKYYQGDTASVSITFKSNIADELEITRIGVQFDWMPEDAYYSYDLSANPVTIPGLGSHIFDLTNIPFTAGAIAGSHSYFVSVDGLQDSVGFIWNSPSLIIQIYSGNEKLYYQLEPQVKAEIDNATYTNSEAQSLLQQAKASYNDALSSAANEEWLEAVTSLRTASDYVGEAEVAEQRGGGGEIGGNLLLYLAVVAIVVVIALSVIAVVVSRRKRSKTDFVA